MLAGTLIGQQRLAAQMHEGAAARGHSFVASVTACAQLLSVAGNGGSVDSVC